ncbi:hypothetical protein RHGRI_031200 [Rhododendron griersonianum]|uniref:Retrotransposon gag domain-containing protein n=1 Tax=Rhododendron griersonianum TaxID=479676 RepID=A0AAV6I705_9ERIC|nr:hypothetical protein RHGRI_031200 [Rhododendron griersonianum]
MGVTDAQKVTLATFSLKGMTQNWWEASEKQLIAALPGVTPMVQRVVTCERFVQEYETRFAKLSEYATDLVDTEAKKYKRFRFGLSSKVASRLTTYETEDYAALLEMTTYETEDYAALLEMTRRIGLDIQDS